MKEETKKCTKCGRTLPLSRFPLCVKKHKLKNGDTRIYKRKDSWCKKCHNKQRKTANFLRDDKRHDHQNDIDRAMSTNDGFNALLKEYGL